ncbi:unnamed protein product [Hymenolepis diminuta]|uniref:Uncharacterized protein n=1 Tax=Hymenolepis diminuta TaxID=6216 RepID=A0A564YAB4_HYMDI|nr:unnamed protein product [Hymenolepis diminuta]
MVVASVSFEREMQQILAESIRNTPVSVVDIRKEAEKDTVPRQAAKKPIRQDPVLCPQTEIPWTRLHVDFAGLHESQLRRRLAESTSDKRYLSLYSLLDTFNLTHFLPPRSQIIDQVTVPSRTAGTRWKSSHLYRSPVGPRRPTGDLPKKGDVRRNDNYFPSLPIFLL